MTIVSMATILAGARLLLFAIFALACGTKLADQVGTRHAIIGFGIPERLIGPLPLALPAVELAIAVGLLFPTTAWFAAVAAVGLLCIFIAAIGFNLAHGRKPNCHCFGQIHSAPVGPSTLALDAALLALAALVVWQGWDGDPGPSLLAWILLLQVGEVIQLGGAAIAIALLAGLAALVWQMLHQQGRILLRLDELQALIVSDGEFVEPPANPTFDPLRTEVGLPVGHKAPTFELSDISGKKRSLESLLENKQPLLLLFANPHCGPCDVLLPEVASWQRDHADVMSIAVISEGNKTANRKKVAVHGISPVLLQQNQEMAQLFHAWGTPAALIINADSTIGSRVAQGADAIRILVQWMTHGSPVAQNGSIIKTANIGEVAPAVQLPDLSGKLVNATSLNNQRTLILFWDPACGFCQKMFDRLKAWDADRKLDAPELLVISRGTVDENRAMRLRAPVLLDQGFKTAPLFGASGTPMAVMLDARGKIASEVVGGADQVFALASLTQTSRNVVDVALRTPA